MNVDEDLSKLCSSLFMEKEAVLTPTTALKALNHSNAAVRAAGRIGASIQGYAPRAHEVLNAMNTGVQTVGAPYALATLKGSAVRDAGIKGLAGLKKLSPERAKRVMEFITHEYTNSPFSTMINPFSHLIDKGYSLVGAAGRSLGI